jgi:hypothetical protein
VLHVVPHDAVYSDANGKRAEFAGPLGPSDQYADAASRVAHTQAVHFHNDGDIAARWTLGIEAAGASVVG